MEPGIFSASPFLPLIGWSVVLLVVHILLQGWTATKELGSQWNAGPRDEGRKPSGHLAGRAERASANFRETYPAFIALALALVFKRVFLISARSSGSVRWPGLHSCFSIWFFDGCLHP
jgi:uncharacterized MAPEG superfamily protein